MSNVDNEDTQTRSWKHSIIPNNPNRETDPDQIDWATDSDEKLDNNLRKIIGPQATKGNNRKKSIHRHNKAPQIGGLKTNSEYQ